MKKRIMGLLLCMAFILTACAGSKKAQGVYYSKISEKDISQKYQSGACYRCSLLHYDGKMYTSCYTAGTEDKGELLLESVLGDEIGKVYGNHLVYWSTDGGELSESTLEGTLYRMNGYGEDFRVALYCESQMPYADTTYHLLVFEHLNDITLEKGSELFRERMHLDQAVKVDGEPDGFSAAEFLEALNNGTFIDPEDAAYPALDNLPSYELTFWEPTGLSDRITVYEDGYVSYQSGGEIFAIGIN